MHTESPDHVMLLDTPPGDIQLMEQLLDVQEGTLPKFVCRFIKGAEKCGKCGRHYSVLDMAKTGLQFHDKRFIKAAIFGEHGVYLWNDNVQLHDCFACGGKAPRKMGYHTNTYGCGNREKAGDNDGDKEVQ